MSRLSLNKRDRFTFLKEVCWVPRASGQVKRKKLPNEMVRHLNAEHRLFHEDEIADWRLSAMDDVAMLNMARKWDVPQVSPPQEDIGYLIAFLDVINLGIYHKCLPYTFEEVKLYVQRPKSPGYPWTELGFNTKGDLLDCPMFTKWFKWSSKVQYHFFFSLFPKEELRPGIKVDNKSTRAIMNAPMDFLLRYGRFIYPLLNQLLRAPLRGPSTLGICPYYGGWNMLAKKLNNHVFGLEADIEANDMSQNFTIMLVGHLFNKLYLALSADDEAEFDFCFLSSVFKFVVLKDGTVVYIPFGRATGEINTAKGNTDNCMIIIFWAISYMIEDFVGLGRSTRSALNFFTDNFIVCVNGDDNNFSFSHKVVSWFTAENFCPYAKRLGFRFSFSTPVPQVPTAMRFLGLGFKFYNGIFIPVADKSKLLAGVFNSGTVKERPQPWLCLARLCSLRMLMFPHDSEFERLTYLINLFMYLNDPIYTGVKEWQDAKRSYFTKYELAQLYCGYESGRSLNELSHFVSPGRLNVVQRKQEI